jgi:predicted ester cyclase
MSPNGVARGNSTGGADIHGPAEFVRFVESIRAAFSEMDMKVEDAFGVADQVVVRWSAKMTHSGDGLGMPATGKPVLLSGISIVRIINGKIVEGWDNWDQLGMLEQIGAYTRSEAVPLQKSA